MAEYIFRWTTRNSYIILGDNNDIVIKNVYEDQIRFLLKAVGEGIIHIDHIGKDKMFVVEMETFGLVARFKISYYDRKGHIKDANAEISAENASPIFKFLIQSLFDKQQR